MLKMIEITDVSEMIPEPSFADIYPRIHVSRKIVDERHLHATTYQEFMDTVDPFIESDSKPCWIRPEHKMRRKGRGKKQ